MSMNFLRYGENEDLLASFITSFSGYEGLHSVGKRLWIWARQKIQIPNVCNQNFTKQLLIGYRSDGPF